MLTIVTRVGHGSKIIFTGDIEQIDNPFLTPDSNGLSILIEQFKDDDLAGHITLKESLRSELAERAAKKLNPYTLNMKK
jgi:PhoH-like ATPase